MLWTKKVRSFLFDRWNMKFVIREYYCYDLTLICSQSCLLMEQKLKFLRTSFQVSEYLLLVALLLWFTLQHYCIMYRNTHFLLFKPRQCLHRTYFGNSLWFLLQFIANITSFPKIILSRTQIFFRRDMHKFLFINKQSYKI